MCELFVVQFYKVCAHTWRERKREESLVKESELVVISGFREQQ